MREPVLLLWSQVLAVYAAANYFTRDPLRGEGVPAATGAVAAQRRWTIWVVTRAIVTGAVVGYLSSHVLLAMMVTIASLALPFVRRAISPRWVAEIEVASLLGVSLISAWIITSGAARVTRAMFQLPFANQRISAACIVAALLLATVHGGTYIVRGVLNKAGAVPVVGGEQPVVDVREFNRGRLIGALERVLLFSVVLAGSYEALAFVIAAKGLIRSRELETSRDMTEYFLIGSLTSVLVALATGSLARYVVKMYW